MAEEGYTQPTPIQEAVIPVMMEGRDLVGIAQTGTGKTAAFTLPLLDRILKLELTPQQRGCTAIILAPTRELVAQIADNIRTYGRFSKPAVALVVGGTKHGPQIKAMAPGVDILVATPGRLLDHMSTGAIRLDKTSVIVLDEADQMLDLGFMPAIREVLRKMPKQRQTALLSATMPKQIRELARDFLTDPAEIAVTPASRPIERIDQSVRHMSHSDKRETLNLLLKDDDVECAIVFTRTKRGADRVAESIVKSGLNAAAIHGNKSQNQRERTMRDFKAGRTTILVATDIAARGLDIDGVSHVFNYELPNVPEAYVHRIGRTARAGRSGIAISFCDGSERGYLKDIEKLIGNPLEAIGDPQPFEDPPTKKQGQQANNRRPSFAKPTQRKPRASQSANSGKVDGSKPSRPRRSRPRRKTTSAVAG